MNKMDIIKKRVMATQLRITVKELDERIAKRDEQRKNLNPNKKYILDPFVGYIEK